MWYGQFCKTMPLIDLIVSSFIGAPVCLDALDFSAGIFIGPQI
jgi:hypothetical protein